MYAQQQTRQTTTSSYDLVSGAPVCDTEPASNQALAEDAGLVSDTDLDLGLLGDMAGFVLDTLPLEAAVLVASKALEESGVQAWVGQQDPAAVVLAMASSMPSTLLSAWPVGLGLFLEGEVGAALGVGGDLSGDIELMHTDADGLQVKIHSKAVVGIDKIGALLELSGGGDQALAALGATGKLDVEAEQTAIALVELEPTMLLAMGLVGAPGSVLALLAGSFRITQGMPSFDLPDFIDPGEYSQERRLAVVSSLSAQASNQALDLLPADLSALVEELRPYLDGLTGFFDGSYSGEVELLTGSDGASLTLRHSLSALVELAGIPILAELIDLELLETLSQTLGGQGQIELVGGLDLSQGLLRMEPDLRASILLERSVGDRLASDRLDLDLTELPSVVSALLAGEGLFALLPATGFQRSVELPAPAELVDQVVPELATSVTGLMSDNGVIAGRDDLHLEGTLTAGEGVMASLGQAGVQAPETMALGDALADIHQALCSLAGGQDSLPAWLEPWRDAVTSAAADMELLEPRLVGQVKLALGFEGKGTGGASVGMEAKGGAGFSVDRVLDGATAATVLQALAQGAFSLPSAAASPESNQGQADTGTETASSPTKQTSSSPEPGPR